MSEGESSTAETAEPTLQTAATALTETMTVTERGPALTVAVGRGNPPALI